MELFSFPVEWNYRALIKIHWETVAWSKLNLDTVYRQSFLTLKCLDSNQIHKISMLQKVTTETLLGRKLIRGARD